MCGEFGKRHATKTEITRWKIVKRKAPIARRFLFRIGVWYTYFFAVPAEAPTPIESPNVPLVLIGDVPEVPVPVTVT